MFTKYYVVVGVFQCSSDASTLGSASML